jgi:hypothetical protein
MFGILIPLRGCGSVVIDRYDFYQAMFRILDRITKTSLVTAFDSMIRLTS